MSGFNPYSIVPFITSFVTAALGLFCYIKNHSSRIHQLFFLLCLSVVIWPLGLGVLLNMESASDVIWWTKAGHVTCTVAPAIFFDFVVRITDSKKLQTLVKIIYLYCVFAILGMWSTEFYFDPTEIYVYNWGPYAKAGPLALVDALYGAGISFTAWVLLFKAHKKAKIDKSPSDFNRFRYIALALVFFSFALLDYLPKFNISVPPMGSFFIVAFTVTIAYAIVRHQILDFTIVIRRTAVYSILAAFITASYLVVILLMEKQFQDVFGYRSIIVTAVVGFLITLSFIPAKNRIQRFVDRFFFRGTHIELAEENKQLRKEVQRAEKLRAVSTLAAGMAHEIKNPLASIKTFIEYVPEKFDDPIFREKLVRITGQEVNKMNNLVQRLLEFARPIPPALQPQNISRLIQDTIDFLQGSLLSKHIQIQTVFSGNDSALIDSSQIKQAFLNILINSIEAMEGPGLITISIVQVNGNIDIAFLDNGPGIAKKDMARLFDPFFTTKSDGTGLGLSVVHTIVQEHGGRVEVESEVGKGTTVRISLPVSISRKQGGRHVETTSISS